jgi:hypothetical protein
VGELFVITKRFAFWSLKFLAEVTTARLGALQSIATHELAQLQEVRDSARFFQFLVEIRRIAGNKKIAPKLGLEFLNFGNRLLQTSLISSHSAVVPHDFAQATMKRISALLALDAHELFDPTLHIGQSLLANGIVWRHRSQLLATDIIGHRERSHEIAISKALHQS